MNSKLQSVDLALGKALLGGSKLHVMTDCQDSIR